MKSAEKIHRCLRNCTTNTNMLWTTNCRHMHSMQVGSWWMLLHMQQRAMGGCHGLHPESMPSSQKCNCVTVKLEIFVCPLFRDLEKFATITGRKYSKIHITVVQQVKTPELTAPK